MLLISFYTIPGAGHLPLTFISPLDVLQLIFFPIPGKLPTSLGKSANARGLARAGGWALLELTDALQQIP